MGCLVFFEGFADEYEAVRQSALGPTLPTFALQQIVGYLRYTGRDANVVAKAALDPDRTRGSIRLRACDLHNLGPFLPLVDHAPSDVREPARNHRCRHVREPLRLLWKTPIFPSNSRFPRLCAKCLLKLKRLVSILPMNKSKK